MISSLLRYNRRAARADAHRLARPVVSIGNLSMGGRGKTPLAALVAQLLVDAGERPAILSRGYGRQIADDGVTIVSEGRPTAGGGADTARFADLAHSGDEPLMLARAVPGAAVLVCEHRALAGALAERALGCTVHVLDDGFQHHQLHRDVDIVLVAPEDFTARVVPFGRLREPLDTLSEADAILLDGYAEPGAVAKLPHCDGASFTGVLARQLGRPSVELPSNARVFAVAGIAGPSRFFDALPRYGFEVVGSLAFRDHHAFTAADVARIATAAGASGAAAIVTTVKDAVRLEGLGPWPVPLVEIPLNVRVEPGEAFREWLMQAIRAV